LSHFILRRRQNWQDWIRSAAPSFLAALAALFPVPEAGGTDGEAELDRVLDVVEEGTRLL
jgi:hypothetical protein